MKIKILKAEHGDCFLVSQQINENQNVNILIDGGTRNTYRRALRPVLDNLVNDGESLHTIIVTHIDDDHISGIIQLFEDDEFLYKLKPQKVIYNMHTSKLEELDNNISFRQGNLLAFLIDRYNNKHKVSVDIAGAIKGDVFDIEGMRLDILTPSIQNVSFFYKVWDENNNYIAAMNHDYDQEIKELKETHFDINSNNVSLSNKSSISFIMSYNEKKVLMMGDAPPDCIKSALDKIKTPINLDVIKLSHHGGDNSMSEDLLEKIKCNKYIISTNGKKFCHPKKRTLAHIIHHNPKVEFYLNYTRNVFSKKELEEYKFKYLEDVTEMQI